MKKNICSVVGATALAGALALSSCTKDDKYVDRVVVVNDTIKTSRLDSFAVSSMELKDRLRRCNDIFYKNLSSGEFSKLSAAIDTLFDVTLLDTAVQAAINRDIQAGVENGKYYIPCKHYFYNDAIGDWVEYKSQEFTDIEISYTGTDNVTYKIQVIPEEINEYAKFSSLLLDLLFPQFADQDIDVYQHSGYRALFWKNDEVLMEFVMKTDGDDDPNINESVSIGEYTYSRSKTDGKVKMNFYHGTESRYYDDYDLLRMEYEMETNPSDVSINDVDLNDVVIDLCGLVQFKMTNATQVLSVADNFKKARNAENVNEATTYTDKISGLLSPLQIYYDNDSVQIATGYYYADKIIDTNEEIFDLWPKIVFNNISQTDKVSLGDLITYGDIKALLATLSTDHTGFLLKLIDLYK